MKTCLITGATGFLGSEVMRRLGAAGNVVGQGFARSVEPELRRCDLRQADAVRRLVDEVAPQAVIHLAAYRDPDFCEDNKEAAEALNVGATRALCRAVPGEVPLILASSDYVFDGESPPYGEADPPSPVNYYGAMKAEAEALVLARAGGAVVRFPLLIGSGPTLADSGFLGQLVEAVMAQEAVGLDDVNVRYPTWTRDVAALMEWLLDRRLTGIFHFRGLRGGTRYGWCREVAEILAMSADHLRPSPATATPRAKRPPNSKLALTRLEELGYDGFTDFTEVVCALLEDTGLSRG